MNLCSSAVNSQRLWLSQKADVKCSNYSFFAWYTNNITNYTMSIPYVGCTARKYSFQC